MPARPTTLEIAQELRAQVEQLQAEREKNIDLINEMKLMIPLHEAVSEKDKAVKREREKGEADRKRLDWLLKFSTKKIEWRTPMNGHGWRLIIDGIHAAEAATQYEAIDAVMLQSSVAAWARIPRVKNFVK